MVRGCLVSLLVLSHAGLAQAQGYVGAQRCGTCHPFAFAKWSEGPHARAQLVLRPNELLSSKCNTCHTMAPESDDSALAGVQCEQCHGVGKYYAADYVMRDQVLSRAVGLIQPGADQCRRCHTEGAPSIEPFDFAAMWARIDHGAKAREAWWRSHASSDVAASGVR